MALRNIGVNYEVVGISEIDKYAIKAYEATHGDVNNLGDISKIKVEDVPEHDLFTYSFCCQDVSVAGKQKGIERGKTRSGLLYECERIIEHCKPKYLLMENVKNLVGKKFKPQFDEWLKYLENLGYTNYWQVLNAKDYDIPQNRERVFVVSILGEHKPYAFPNRTELKRKLKDYLEPSVNSKYYIKKKKSETLMERLSDKGFLSLNVQFTEDILENPTIDCLIGSYQKNAYTGNGDISSTLTNAMGAGGGHVPVVVLKKENKVNLRKLTPRECFRLMGLSDDDINKIQSVDIANTQQYKMAGNSIVVPVLEGIFRELFL